MRGVGVSPFKMLSLNFDLLFFFTFRAKQFFSQKSHFQ